MNKIGKIFILIGILLIVVSSCLLVRNNYEEHTAKEKSNVVLQSMKDNIESQKKEVTEVVFNEDTSIEKEMSVVNIDGYDYMGVITIPSLGIELPIMNDYDESRLRIAPVRYYGSIFTNDLVICAHSYKTHFGNLSKLKQEDVVILTDVNGESYLYEVLEIEVLDATDVEEMLDSEFDLTLYTCTSDGRKRVTVRCNKIVDV